MEHVRYKFAVDGRAGFVVRAVRITGGRIPVTPIRVIAFISVNTTTCVHCERDNASAGRLLST